MMQVIDKVKIKAPKYKLYDLADEIILKILSVK